MTEDLRRIIYRSRSTGDARAAAASILVASRANNGLDGISGILWNDEARYVQVLEGPPESVAAALARIMVDDRHEEVDVVSDTTVSERAFADWSMAGGPGERPGDAKDRMFLLLAGTPSHVRDDMLVMIAKMR
jgi:hypothetical protein